MKGFADKVRILQSPELITSARLVRELRISRGLADNTLAAWLKDGLLKKLSAGCFVSASVPMDQKALWDTCDIRIGRGKWLLMGPSSWQRAKWDLSTRGPIYLATSDPRSTKYVHIDGVEPYPIGQVSFKFWEAYAVAGRDNGNPRAVHPVFQMTWWMNGNCPGPMSTPESIDWNKLYQDPNLFETVRSATTLIKAPKSLTKEGFPAFYTLLNEQIERLQQAEANQRELVRECESEDTAVQDMPR